MHDDIQGSGWKTGVGSTLVGLAGIGAAGNIGAGDVAAGVIGGAVLAGIGGALIHADRKKGSGLTVSGGALPKIQKSQFQKEFNKVFKKLAKGSQSGSGMGGKLTNAKIKELMKQHQNTEISIKDVFGKDWRKKGKQLYSLVSKQMGGNIFKKIGKAAKESVKASKKKLKQWVGEKPGTNLVT